jgi:chromosome segregation ATPase
MACNGKSREVAVEELNVLLCFVESENVALEQEKKNLTIKYHSRPAEERNIMRDILEMHTEFEKDIIKLKEITEDFSKIPHLKNNVTDITEERLNHVAQMQQEIIQLQERIQKLLLEKSELQSKNEGLQRQYNELSNHTNLVIEDIDRLESLENEEVFNEQYHALESEIDRMTELVLILEGKTTIDYPILPPVDIPYLTERQASDYLRSISIENQMLEEAVDSYAKVLAEAHQEEQMKVDIEEKKKKIEQLNDRLTEVKDEIDGLEKKYSGFSVSLDKNLKILDRIIEKRTVSPKSNFLNKNKELLNDVISSINRAKALTSPNKFK